MDRAALLATRYERHRRLALGVTALVVLLAAPFSGRWGGAELALAGLVVVLFGLPHGALDALIALRARGDRRSLPIVAAYVGLAALTVLFWQLWPIVALLVFLALSLLHFGRGDVPHARRGDALVGLEVAVRGGLPLVLPMVFHPNEVGRIFAMLVDAPEARVQAVIAASALPLGLFWATAAVALVVLRLRARGASAQMELIELAALLSAFALLSPLLAFALYFGAWHSVRHLLVLHTWLGERDRIAVLRRGTPILAATLLLAALAYTWTADQPLDPRAFAQVLFIGLAALTVPHMFVTLVLDHQLRPRPELAPSPQ